MNHILPYILSGALLYPVVMDMYIRVQYKRKRLIVPDSLGWYLGFYIFIFTWVISLPILSVKYIKEMKK